MPKDIWCEAGKQNVSLPDGAFNQSFLSPSVVINPCEGCVHKGHLSRLKYNESNIESGELVGRKLKQKLTHSVQVVTYLGKHDVQCTCNCCIEKV